MVSFEVSTLITERCVKCQESGFLASWLTPNEINSQAQCYQIKLKARALTLLLKGTKDSFMPATWKPYNEAHFLDWSTVFRYNEIVIHHDGIPKSSWREQIWSKRDEISSGQESMSERYYHYNISRVVFRGFRIRIALNLTLYFHFELTRPLLFPIITWIIRYNKAASYHYNTWHNAPLACIILLCSVGWRIHTGKFMPITIRYLDIIIDSHAGKLMAPLHGTA